MHFSTAVALALSAAASLVAAEDKCQAQNIVDACVSSYQARIQGCNAKPNDYICMCDVYTDVLVCYNNCPDSTAKSPVQNQVTQFCQAAKPLRADQSASAASVASVAATQTQASTAASTTPTASGSGSASKASASPKASSFASKANGVGGEAAVGLGAAAFMAMAALI